MNINQLKYVLVIAESTSIREAVNRLYVSQPALSSSIRDLEEELGIVIFERSNKGIRLTDEGREFVNYAKRAVGQYMLLEERYLSADRAKERFSVSTQHYNFAAKAFAEVIKRFDPDKFEFLIHETRTLEVLENVRDLKSEVGIVSYSGSNKEFVLKLIKDYGLEFVTLMSRDTYIYLWKGHPLSDRSELTFEELKCYPCISFDQGEEGKFYIAEEAMGDHVFDRSIKSDDRATTMELIKWLNGYSVGSGILSEEGAVVGNLVSVKLKEEDPLTIGYITLKNMKLTKYGTAYVEELEKYREL